MGERGSIREGCDRLKSREMREEGKGKELDAESEHHEMMRTMGGLEISKLEKIWEKYGTNMEREERG